MTYAEKLKDPRWQKKRLEILERDGFECQVCWSDEKELHVHHKLYKNGYDPWEYGNDDLETLCKDCHKNTDYLNVREAIDVLHRKITNYHCNLHKKDDPKNSDEHKSVICSAILIEYIMKGIKIHEKGAFRRRDKEVAKKCISDIYDINVGPNG